MKRILFILAVCAVSILRAEVIYWMGDASENEIEFYFAHVAVVKDGDVENVIAYLNFADNPDEEAMLGNEGGYMTGASWADISNYTSNEYGFFVEIMNYGKPNTDPFGDDQWYVAGVSHISGYQDLVSAGHVYTDSLSIPNISAAWAPTVVIPEPSGALLLVFGLSVLALRRRSV